MDYIQKMLTAFAWKLDEYYSGSEHPDHIERLVEEFLHEFDPYDQPERLSEKTCRNGYFPPPWDINAPENREKTIGWIAFQEEMRKDPEYYKMR